MNLQCCLTLKFSDKIDMIFFFLDLNQNHYTYVLVIFQDKFSQKDEVSTGPVSF